MRGSIIQIFLTGEGVTNPAAVTGGVTQSGSKSPIQPVSVQIGGADAKVVSASSAPGAISGLLQVNAIIPSGSGSGSVPVVVRIGNANSQPTATVAIQ